ncbi:DUF397 domain-containing protein [Streptomyces sp. NPDC002851]
MKPSKGIDLSTVAWRKSSYSNGQGADCVEVADLPDLWRKSSYSNGDGADCLEVRDDLPGLIPVRDSKNTEGPVLVFPAAAWAAFVHELRGSVG